MTHLGALNKAVLDRFMALDISSMRKVSLFSWPSNIEKLPTQISIDSMHVHLDRWNWGESQSKVQNGGFSPQGAQGVAHLEFRWQLNRPSRGLEFGRLFVPSGPLP